MNLIGYKINNYVALGAVSVICGVSYLVFSGIKRRATVKQVFKELENLEAGEGDSSESLEYSVAFDPKYWKKYEKSAPAHTQAVAWAKKFNGYLGTIADENGVYALLKQMPSKVALSKVSDVYATVYGKDFIKDLKSMDVFGSSAIDEVRRIVSLLPLK